MTIARITLARIRDRSSPANPEMTSADPWCGFIGLTPGDLPWRCWLWSQVLDEELEYPTPRVLVVAEAEADDPHQRLSGQAVGDAVPHLWVDPIEFATGRGQNTLTCRDLGDRDYWRWDSGSLRLMMPGRPG